MDFRRFYVPVGELTDEYCKLEATNRVLALQEAELEMQLKKTKKPKAHAISKLKYSLLADFENSDPIDWFTGICACAPASVSSSSSIQHHQQPNPIDDDWSTAPFKGSAFVDLRSSNEKLRLLIIQFRSNGPSTYGHGQLQ
jgi:hypothetical protein